MKRKLFIASFICSVALAFFLYTNASSQTSFKSYTITLYSGGRSVGTWQSFQVLDNGSESVSFYIGSQTFPKKVTVRGTYSVEQTQ